MSAELIILSVTGIIALLTYIIKHCRGSECWTKEKCFSIKMDRASISEPPTPPAPPPTPDEPTNIKISSIV